MKKKVFALLLCGVWQLAAQPDFSELKFGARAGIGLGSVTISYDDDNTFQSGFLYSVGAYAELPVWRAVNLVVEMDFEHTSISDESKSMAVETVGGISAQILSTTWTKYPLNYLRIPILARANILDKILYVDTYTRSKVTTIAAGYSNTTDTENTSEDSDHFKKAHFAFDLGWGFNLGQVSLGVRACIGASDLQAKDYKVDGMRVGFTTLQIGARYTF